MPTETAEPIIDHKIQIARFLKANPKWASAVSYREDEGRAHFTAWGGTVYYRWLASAGVITAEQAEDRVRFFEAVVAEHKAKAARARGVTDN